METQTAVFLDRDGVINELVMYPETGEYEAPKKQKDFHIFPHTVGALKELAKLDCKLFVITNQPDYAKGKTTMEELQAIHDTMHREFQKHGIVFTDYFYCYLHPEAVVPGYLGSECRKPNPFFINEAKKKYNLDMKHTWLIGDQDTDIFAGTAARTRTILIEYPLSAKRRGKSNPDYVVKDLREAVDIILNE